LAGSKIIFDADECQALLDVIDRMLMDNWSRREGKNISMFISTKEESEVYEKLKEGGRFYNPKKESGIAFAIGFENPDNGFIDGPFEKLADALEVYGVDGENCYIYRLTENSSRKIRKWDYVNGKWEFLEVEKGRED